MGLKRVKVEESLEIESNEEMYDAILITTDDKEPSFINELES